MEGENWKGVIALTEKLNIQEAIKHPGALREAARRAGALSKDGKIKLSWVREVAKRKDKLGQRARFYLYTLRPIINKNKKAKGEKATAKRR